jgi:hypothetical protein
MHQRLRFLGGDECAELMAGVRRQWCEIAVRRRHPVGGIDAGHILDMRRCSGDKAAETAEIQSAALVKVRCAFFGRNPASPQCMSASSRIKRAPNSSAWPQHGAMPVSPLAIRPRLQAFAVDMPGSKCAAHTVAAGAEALPILTHDLV